MSLRAECLQASGYGKARAGIRLVERPGWPGWAVWVAQEVLTGLSVTSDRVCAVEAPMGDAVRVGRTPVYLGAERE